MHFVCSSWSNKSPARLIALLLMRSTSSVGGSDGPALQQLNEDYFCGAEQDDEELPDSMFTALHNNCSKYTIIIINNR